MKKYFCQIYFVHRHSVYVLSLVIIFLPIASCNRRNVDKGSRMNTPTINSRQVKCYSTSMRFRFWRISGGHNSGRFKIGNMAAAINKAVVASLLLKNSIIIFTNFYLRNFWPSSCLSSSSHTEHPIISVFIFPQVSSTSAVLGSKIGC